MCLGDWFCLCRWGHDVVFVVGVNWPNVYGMMNDYFVRIWMELCNNWQFCRCWDACNLQVMRVGG